MKIMYAYVHRAHTKAKMYMLIPLGWLQVYNYMDTSYHLFGGSFNCGLSRVRNSYDLQL